VIGHLDEPVDPEIPFPDGGLVCGQVALMMIKLVPDGVIVDGDQKGIELKPAAKGIPVIGPATAITEWGTHPSDGLRGRRPRWRGIGHRAKRPRSP